MVKKEFIFKINDRMQNVNNIYTPDNKIILVDDIQKSARNITYYVKLVAIIESLESIGVHGVFPEKISYYIR